MSSSSRGTPSGRTCAICTPSSARTAAMRLWSAPAPSARPHPPGAGGKPRRRHARPGHAPVSSQRHQRHHATYAGTAHPVRRDRRRTLTETRKRWIDAIRNFR
jgi:hypothetical protein